MDSILSTPPVVIPPAPSPNVRFASLRHWFSRSEQTSEAAEARLLSRLAYFTLGGKTLGTPADSKTTAKVGLVDLDGDGIRKINTLVIDQEGNDFVIEKDGSIPSLSSPSKTNSYTPSEIEDKQLGLTSEPQTDLNLQSNASTVSEGKNSSIKNLVMCHGFGAGLGFFYRNYHGLSQVPGWKIYSIDWLGMGRSSRPKFTIKGKTVDEYVKETENFFIDSLEKWREIHQIDKMTLLGHSLGGYLAAVYALKYPSHVEKLILVSPVGIPRNPQNDPEFYGHNVRQLPGWVVRLWNANFTPQLVLRWLGPFGPSLVSKYTTRRFSHLEEKDQLDLHDYIYHISTATGSGEFAITRLLEPGAYARKPLIDRLNEIKMPTTFLYGEHDWMDHRAAEKAKSLMNVHVKVRQIPDAGHHLYLDNPTEFNKAVIEEILSVK